MVPGGVDAQVSYLSRLDEKIVVESGTASQVTQKVRAAAPGVLMEVFVKVGETVKKGQILGHTELTTAKYQLDLARLALENNAAISGMEGQADAWKATREETEEALRRRKVDKSRLEWAAGMEKFYASQYEGQLEQKKVQRVQFEYCKEQYENRFFRAPVDGVITQVLLEVGKPVSYATHVFTIGNEESYMIPVSVPAELAAAAVPNATLPIRATNGKHVARGLVDSVADDPKSPGNKIITLLANEGDFPVETGSRLAGAKFDVLLPQTADQPQNAGDHSAPAAETASMAPAARP